MFAGHHHSLDRHILGLIFSHVNWEVPFKKYYNLIRINYVFVNQSFSELINCQIFTFAFCAHLREKQ